MPKFHSSIAEMIERMEDVGFDEAKNDAARELERYADEALIVSGMLTEDEHTLMANVALEINEDPSISVENIARLVSHTPEEVRRAREDARFQIVLELTRLGDRLIKASTLGELDQAIAEFKTYMEQHLTVEPGVVEFRVLQKLIASSKRNRESVRELTEYLKKIYGVEPDEAWDDLMEAAFDARRTEPPEREGKTFPFRPKTNR